MALNATSVNCQVTTWADGQQKLSAEPGIISAPGAESQTGLGGLMQWSLLLDPSADIKVGDELQIVWRGTYPVDQRQRFYIQAVYPTAPYPYEAWDVRMVDKQQR